MGDWCRESERERDSLEAAGVQVTQSIRWVTVCGSQKHSGCHQSHTTWYSVGLLVPHSLTHSVREWVSEWVSEWWGLLRDGGGVTVGFVNILWVCGLWGGWDRGRLLIILFLLFFLLLLLLFSCFFFLLFVVVVVLVPLFSYSPPPLSAKITKMNKYNPNFIQYPLKLLRNTHTYTHTWNK